MKTLVLDIETGPSLAYVWSLWDQNVSLKQVEEFGEVLCFAAKWLDKKSVIYKSSYHHSKEEMVQEAWDLIDQADAIIHYNGRAFDIKHLNREFLLAGMMPPSAHKDIDLLTVARRRFKFTSNKLDHVAQQLGLGGKLQHAGFELWKGCLEGDKASWETMKKYNKQDVVLTEEVYYKLRPWIHNHPNTLLYDDKANPYSCRVCGSANLQKRGYTYTAMSRFQQYQCNDCGSYQSDKSRDLAAVSKSVTV